MTYLNCRIAEDGTLEWGLHPPSGELYETCFVPLTRFYPAYCETLAALQQRNPDMSGTVAADLVLDRLWERREELQRKGEAVSVADAQAISQVPCLSLEVLRTAKERLQAERSEIVKRLAADDLSDMRDTLGSLALTISDLQEAIFALDDMLDEQDATVMPLDESAKPPDPQHEGPCCETCATNPKFKALWAEDNACCCLSPLPVERAIAVQLETEEKKR